MDFSKLQMLIDAAALLDIPPDRFGSSSFTETNRSLQEQTQTTLTAEHPSLQAFSSFYSESPDQTIENATIDETGTTLSACEPLPEKQELHSKVNVSMQSHPECNPDTSSRTITTPHESNHWISPGTRVGTPFLENIVLSLDQILHTGIEKSLEESTRTTLTADHPPLQTFNTHLKPHDQTTNENIEMIECTGTTLSADEPLQEETSIPWNIQRSVDEHSNGISNYSLSLPRHCHGNYSGSNLQPQMRSIEPPATSRYDESTKSTIDRLSTSLPTRSCSNYSSRNLLLRRHPADASFGSQKIRSRKRSSNNSSSTGGRLSKTLPESSLANYSGGNVLLGKLPTYESIGSQKEENRKFKNSHSSPAGGRLNTSLSAGSLVNNSGNLLFRKLHDERFSPRKEETRKTKSNITDEITPPSMSVAHSDFPHITSICEPDPEDRATELNSTFDTIRYDLSFHDVYSSTPKRKKVRESENDMNIGNISEDRSDHQPKFDSSDPEYVPGNDPDFESEDDGTEVLDIDNEGMDFIIGDAKSLTKFSLDEYFEKYRNRTVISDDELEEDKETSNNNENEDAIGDLGFEELEKDDCRKKKKKTQLWQINKIAKERGQEYSRIDGTVVPARKIQDPCRCTFLKCFEKYSDAVREQLLTSLLKLSLSGQNQFISNHMAVSVTTRPTVLNSRRIYTRKYYLPAANGRVRVCKTMFTSTLNIKDKKTRCLSKKIILNNGISYDDQRANNGGQRRISTEHIMYIENHIKSFPAYTSHYGREKSSKMYLSSDLTIAKMFRLYKKKCIEEGLEPVNYNSYRIVFGTFKLAFRRPSKDTCPDCDKFAIQLKTSSDLEEKSKVLALRDTHQQHAKRMYEEKKADVYEAKHVEGVRTVSFDLQKCLPTPHLQCGTAYYCRQLYTLNFTIFSTEGNRNLADCYIWDETKARRGSQEVGSCLLQDLTKMDLAIKFVNYYSDRCSGQNLNYVICLTFLMFIRECNFVGREMIIRHKLMISGHSHMEVDSVHASIERAKSRSSIDIETPRDWAVFIGSIERKVPFKVHEMEQKDFKALKILEHHFKRPTKNTVGQKIKFREISMFEYRSAQPDTVYYKYHVNEDEFLSFKVDTQGEMPELSPIATEPLPLAPEKLQDLKKLMKFVTNKQYYETFLRNLVPKKRGRRAQKGGEDHFDADLDPEEDFESEN